MLLVIGKILMMKMEVVVMMTMMVMAIVTMMLKDNDVMFG